MATLLDKMRPTILAVPRESQVQYDTTRQREEVTAKAEELGFYNHESSETELLAALQVLANRMGRYDAADYYSNKFSYLTSFNGKV